SLQQVKHAAVFLQRARCEQFRFLLERVEKSLVEVRVESRIGNDFGYAPQIQPLRCEIAHQRNRARIPEHPPHLLIQDLRIAQLSLFRKRQQWLIGNAAPQKERQPRREFDIGEGVRLSGPGLWRVPQDPQQKVRVDEKPLQSKLDPGVKASAFFAAGLEK